MGAIEAIREVDPLGDITLISEEICPYYSRPMISDLVSGKADFSKMKCRDDDFWKKNKVSAIIDQKAISLDLLEKQITMEKEGSIKYEKLLIATGGKPFIPKILGCDKEGVYSFTTLSDATLLKNKIEKSKNVIVVGGGLIGVSVTEALVNRGLKVTMVELKDSILSLILDIKASKMFQKQIEEAGVTILTGQTIKEIIGQPDNERIVGGVKLTTGEKVHCDLIIIAIGVIPRKDITNNTNLKTNRGILVDRRMQTNISDVYAGGDVAEAYDFLFEENRILPLWPLAYQEGKIAGYNMAGKKVIYSGGTAMSSLKYFNMPIISFGITNPKETHDFEILTKTIPEKKIYKKILLKNNKIVGLTFVNDIKKAGVFFQLLRKSVTVRRFKQNLLSEEFGLASVPKSLRKKVFEVD
jgi:NAD(P)H-nitrite reductase large subunit